MELVQDSPKGRIGNNCIDISGSATRKKLRGVVRQRTIPNERPPLVGEVIANFSG
jgi:hypothetical protein